MVSFLFFLSPLLICSASSKVSGSGSFSVDGRNLNWLLKCRNSRIGYQISCTIDMQATARTKIPYFVATTNAAKQPPRLPIESNIPIALIWIYRISRSWGQRGSFERKSLKIPPLTNYCWHTFNGKTVSIVPIVIRKHFT